MKFLNSVQTGKPVASTTSVYELGHVKLKTVLKGTVASSETNRSELYCNNRPSNDGRSHCTAVCKY